MAGHITISITDGSTSSQIRIEPWLADLLEKDTEAVVMDVKDLLGRRYSNDARVKQAADNMIVVIP